MLEDDDPEELAARILEAEHRIYPRAVRLCSGGWTIEGRRCAVSRATAVATLDILTGDAWTW